VPLRKKEEGKAKGNKPKERIADMSRIPKKEIQEKFRRHEKDTGSSEVQVALLTKRIDLLTEHLKNHRKDHSSRYGLIKMVNARRCLLDYLKEHNFERYQLIVRELGLRK